MAIDETKVWESARVIQWRQRLSETEAASQCPNTFPLRVDPRAQEAAHDTPQTPHTTTG